MDNVEHLGLRVGVAADTEHPGRFEVGHVVGQFGGHGVVVGVHDGLGQRLVL
jgi:hypothetical protein